jgi:uncharacterized protein YfkK (UPF0435 family)
MLSETINELTLDVHNLVRKRNELDPDSAEYEELTEEIQLLQNDLTTIAIIGEN